MPNTFSKLLTLPEIFAVSWDRKSLGNALRFKNQFRSNCRRQDFAIVADYALKKNPPVEYFSEKYRMTINDLRYVYDKGLCIIVNSLEAPSIHYF